MKTFTVKTQSDGKTHLGNKEKLPLCGTILSSPVLSKHEIKCFGGKLKMKLPKSTMYKSWIEKGWINVGEKLYCQHCLNKFKKS